MADDEDRISISENEDDDSMAENSSNSDDDGNTGSSTRRKCNEEDEVDRISKLPDSVLRNILTFFPTKVAVGTCIFGKRWKNLWTSAPNIYLDDTFLFNRQNSVNVSSFMNFVEKVLNLHDSKCSIKNFRLECEQHYDPLRVESWLSKIAEFDIKDLELTFPLGHLLDVKLPSSYFNRQNLVKLNLCHLMFFVPYNTVNFPSLKILWLIQVQLIGDDSMNNLLSGCPILWNLDLNRAFWEYNDTYFIRSSSLAHLSVHTDARSKNKNTHRVIVEAPNMELLHLSGNLEYDYDFGDLSTLKAFMLKADKDGLVLPVTCEKDGQVLPYKSEEDGPVSLDTCQEDGPVSSDTCQEDGPVSSDTCQEDGPVSSDTCQEDGQDSPHLYTLSDRLVELLEKMSHVEQLYLYARVVRFLEYASFENFPMFRNLASLNVDIADNSWRILPPLLECSPNLVNLVSKKVFEPEGATLYLEGIGWDPPPSVPKCGFGWDPPPSVPKCLLSSLQIIEFKGFEYCNDEMGMIEYFLKNAMVLKKISVKSKKLDLEKQSLVLRKILMFPRSSDQCGVVLFS